MLLPKKELKDIGQVQIDTIFEHLDSNLEVQKEKEYIATS